MEGDNTTIQKGDNDSSWDITIFSYSDLQRATSDFSDENLLNQSSSGKVYRGEIWGIDVAIKLLRIPDDVEQVKVFRTEVDILRRLNHPHLVSVIGACPQKCAIVYELMSGGSLEDRLSQKDLAWKDRIRIANEICSALAFLHSRKPDMVIGDLKPENILLDANDRIKLTCQFMHRSKTDKSGYSDPIYVQSRTLEPNVDVYAFGMVLLRLLSNKLPGYSLTVEVTEAWENKYLNDVLDNAAQWPYHIAEELCVLALRCCEASDVTLRPDASEISEKLKKIRKLKESRGQQILPNKVIGHIKWDDVTTFSYLDLEKATSYFSDSNKLGEGGFGKVYKGNLWGTEVAIKILISKGDPHQVKAFSQEVDVLRRVNHPHLVSLMGACPEEFALVYQFIPGGTLEDRLSRNNFIWKDRIGIATQICSALVFLHSLKPECVVHGDLKPANILLDANGKGMLGDFGICRRIPVTDTGTKTHLTVTAIQGSDGYLDPVYKQNKTLAPYVDIYAFGMLLLRLLTNQKPESHLIIYDVEYAMKDNQLKDILDKEAKWPGEVANELSKLALNCCFYRAHLRPRSSEVLDKLNQRLHEATKQSALPEKESGSLREAAIDGNDKIQSSNSTSLLNEGRNDNPSEESVDALISFVILNISKGKLVAYTIYKCLLHWRSFEAAKTSVFDRLIEMIGSAIEGKESNEHVVCCLSNTSTLLFLLEKSLKSTAATGAWSRKPIPLSLFGRMAAGFRSSPDFAVDGDILRRVEAKYPALLFKQQISAYVEKFYGIIRDNVKKELSPLLSLCIQALRTTRAAAGIGSRSLGSQTQSIHWQSIIAKLNKLFKNVRENYVPPVLIQKMCSQIFSYINVQLFNSLLLRRECCSFVNGEYVKSGLADLERWCLIEATQEFTGSSWDELKHIRQAVGFLVIHQKHRLSLDEIMNDFCPVLSVQQLYRICTMYWDDKYNTRSVSSDVISNMRILMTEDSNNVTSSSFLLDDDSSFPLSNNDISEAQLDKDFLDVSPPEELLKHPAFQFLRQ